MDLSRAGVLMRVVVAKCSVYTQCFLLNGHQRSGRSHLQPFYHCLQYIVCNFRAVRNGDIKLPSRKRYDEESIGDKANLPSFRQANSPESQ